MSKNFLNAFQFDLLVGLYAVTEYSLDSLPQPVLLFHFF